MEKRKLQIILISVWILSLILTFIICKYSFNSSKTKNELIKVKEELMEWKEKYDEVKQLNENQKETILYLNDENENNIKYITSVKEITSKTKINLEHLEKNTDSTKTLIGELRESNKVLRSYFTTISTIIEEDNTK